MTSFNDLDLCKKIKNLTTAKTIKTSAFDTLDTISLIYYGDYTYITALMIFNGVDNILLTNSPKINLFSKIEYDLLLSEQNL